MNLTTLSPQKERQESAPSNNGASATSSQFPTLQQQPAKPHILILTSATGGGHAACADALRHALQSRYGKHFRTSVVDLWADYAPWPLNRWQRLYYFFTNVIPSIWKLLWALFLNPFVDRIFFGLIGRWVRPKVILAFQELQPDVIITVHPLIQRGVRQAIERLPASEPVRSIPWFTVVTDLASAHPIWFDPHVERCFVPTAEVAQAARSAGVPPEKTITAGLPSLSGSADIDIPGACLDAVIKAKDSGLPTVLVMGGAEGMGPLLRIAQSIEAHLSSKEQTLAQMVIICGTNKQMSAKLARRNWSIPTQILGFVDNVPAWMAASDVLVTKAGPSTITEALNVGAYNRRAYVKQTLNPKPFSLKETSQGGQKNGLAILLTGFLPGQEEGNVDYIVENGAGLFCPNPEQIGRTVRRWLVDSPHEREEFVGRAARLASPSAAEEIVRGIVADLETRLLN